MTSLSVLVTGASGWVGGALTKELAACGYGVRAASRTALTDLPVGVLHNPTELTLGPNTNWRPTLQGVDVVVHCAARVHVLDDQSKDPLAEYRSTNVQGTTTLAEQAAAAGVRRFVFISTAHVNGTMTEPGYPFKADDPAHPDSHYGLSKLEAELGLREICRRSSMEFVIVRPPLVVGPGVGGNVRMLMRALLRRVPMPLASVNNLRSMVGLGNLVGLLRTCIDHPSAAGQVFMAGDGEDISTPELAGRLGNFLGVRARLWHVPPSLLMLSGRLSGRLPAVRSLCAHLQVDDQKSRTLLAWQPSLSLDESLRAAARHFVDHQHTADQIQRPDGHQPSGPQ
jgi:nucleoside-diphosphate-sugar epimerase